MKYVIWGAGERGSRIFKHLGSESIAAFMDMNPDKWGQEIYDKQIINLDIYREKYSDCIIIISFLHDHTAGENLQNQHGVDTYMLLSDCPGEFQEYNIRPILKNYLAGLISKEKKYALLGCSIYSIFLYDLMARQCSHMPVLIVPADTNSGIMNLLSVHGYRYVVSNENSEIEYDEMWGTTFLEEKYLQELNCRNEKFRYVFDCSDDIEEYHNPMIEKFKDIHKGKRCFIIGLGPSLRMEDLDALIQNREVCFSVNRIWEAFKQTNWRPDYYVAIDEGLTEDYIDKFDSIECQYKFIGDSVPEFWKLDHDSNILKFHLAHICPETIPPLFSSDFSRKSYMGYTVTYTCMQLAAYMGFKEIYLLGVDFTETSAQYTHFYGDTQSGVMNYAEYVSLAYQSAKKYTEKHNTKIYNATRGGSLEVFDRVNFDDIIINAV